MRSIALPVLLCLSVTACSPDDDSPDKSVIVSPTNTVSPSNTDSPAEDDFRIASLLVEFALGDFRNSLIEYDYDSAGRIETTRTTPLNRVAIPTTRTFTYGEFGIQTRTDGVDVTETFSYENEQIYQIISSQDGRTNYTYDSEGKLIGVIGDSFFSDNLRDCESAGLVETTVDDRTVFEVAYTGNRLDSITASTGEVISFNYDQQGLPIRETSSGECRGSLTTISEYTYGADSRFLTQSTSTTDTTGSVTDTEELVATYTGDRLTQSVSTVRSSGIVEDVTTNFDYDTSGRLVSTTIIEESESGGVLDIEIMNLTYTYEEENCTQQLSAYPDTIALANIFDVSPIEQAPGISPCAFALDNF